MAVMAIHDRYVCGIVLCGDAVLMLKKNRPEWQDGRFNFMGGKIQTNEVPLEAMRREADEELGFNCSQEIRHWRYLLVEQGPGYECFFFVGVLDPAMISVSPARNDVGEIYQWFPVTSLPSSVIGNCRWALAMALDPRADLRAEVTVTGDISKNPTWEIVGVPRAG